MVLFSSKQLAKEITHSFSCIADCRFHIVDCIINRCTNSIRSLFESCSHIGHRISHIITWNGQSRGIAIPNLLLVPITSIKIVSGQSDFLLS